MTVEPAAAAADEGARVSVDFVVPGDPMGRHWMDSSVLGEQDPASMPPESITWVVSARVVGVPPTVMVTVGGTVIGVQVAGKPLVSKLSKPGLEAGGFSVRMTLWPGWTVNEPHRLSNTLPPGREEWSSTVTRDTVMGAEVGLSSRTAPAS